MIIQIYMKSKILCQYVCEISLSSFEQMLLNSRGISIPSDINVSLAMERPLSSIAVMHSINETPDSVTHQSVFGCFRVFSGAFVCSRVLSCVLGFIASAIHCPVL